MASLSSLANYGSRRGVRGETAPDPVVEAPAEPGDADRGWSATGSTPTKPVYAWDPTTPSAPAPSPTTPVSPDYVGQFRSALDDARANIKAQLAAALDETGRQEGVAQGMVGMLPGQYQEFADQANVNILSMAKGADAAQAKAGARTFSPAAAISDTVGPDGQPVHTEGLGASLAPLGAAMQQALAFQKGGVPLLQMGTQDMFSRRRALAQQIAAEQEGELGREDRQNALQLALEDRRNATQLAGEDRADARHMRDLEAQRAYEGGRDERNFQQTIALHDLDRQETEAAKRPTFGTKEIAYDRGGDLAKYEPQKASVLRTAPAYLDALNDARTAMTDAQLQEKYGHYDPRILSLALFDAGRAPASS